MKKINILFMFILIIFLITTGCGGGEKATVKKIDNEPIGKAETENTEPNDDGGVKVGGTEINIGEGNSGKNLDLPAEFPSDILPLLDDAQINFIMKNDNNKGISVTFGTSRSIEESYEFYKDVMKDGSNTQEIKVDNGYLFMGTKGNYVVAISIVEMNDELNVMLDATPKAQ